MASQEGKVECVEMLLDRGADINMQTEVSGVIIHCSTYPESPVVDEVCLFYACLCTGILFRQALPLLLFDYCYM